MKITYAFIALSVITGFALCIRYSLEQVDQTGLWGGVLLLTAVPVALYGMYGSKDDR